VEAEICGIIAGIISAVASYAIFEMLAPNLRNYGISIDNIVAVLESSKLVLVFLAFAGTGLIIGRVSARLAISRYMHKA
jgi:membrane-anchored glycerophosphoryl diester phosphodiesterase (GDPDase)